MTTKMCHCITVTALTATAGKTVKVGKKFHLMFHYRHTLADYKIVFYFSSSRFQQNRLF